MSPNDQQHAQLTLTSRESWAASLLDRIESKQIQASDLTAYSVRQIKALGNDDLTARLAAHWGNVRETPSDKAKQIESMKKWLSLERLANADMVQGHQLFTKHCASCHQLFGEGGKIGPDITGAQRTNLDYMLENIIDPNAAVANDYQMEILRTEDGRVVTGLIESEGEETITVQTVNERLVFPITDIAARKKSVVSIMPQGLLDPLSENEIRDLMGYLQRKN
jgi:putative heme-binding domain-containing protein